MEKIIGIEGKRTRQKRKGGEGKKIQVWWKSSQAPSLGKGRPLRAEGRMNRSLEFIPGRGGLKGRKGRARFFLQRQHREVSG